MLRAGCKTESHDSFSISNASFMLYLLFQAGGQRYALDVSIVVEVIPLVDYEALVVAPAGVAGFFNYHGQPVLLMDLSRLITGRDSRKWMSSRIIVVRRGKDPSRESGVLGLLAEQATGTLRTTEQAFQHDLRTDRAAHLGLIAVESGQMIQRIEVDSLMTADITTVLSAKDGNSSCHLQP